jgi:uncharacterized protein YbjQ (UPF0145 family)
LSNVLLVTMNEVPGHRIVEVFGVVRGLTVRSRSALGNMVAGVEATFGGRNWMLTDLCEVARDEATRFLIRHAEELGANAVLALRYDATDVSPSITEVLAYGTAVRIEPVGGSSAQVKLSPFVQEPARIRPNTQDQSLSATDETCLECGASIPAAAKACPKCGWTWL